MKRFFFNILLSIFVTLVFLTVLEVTARVMNATLLKEVITTTDLRTKLEQAYIPPFPPKDEEILRVFVFGGSTVQGLPLPKVGLVSQFDYQIRHIFQEKRDLEIYNFGWSGYNSTMIRHLVASTIAQQPDLLIVYTAHNEFIYPQLDSYFLLKGLTLLKDKTGLGKALVTLKNAGADLEATPEKPDRKRSPYRIQPVFYGIKTWLFRQNLQVITKIARQANVPLILSTAASNIADWPPVDRRVTTLADPTEYREALNRVKRLIEEGKLQEADEIVNDSLSKYPDDPPLIYLKAKIASESGESSARQLFIQAKDLDYIPWRARTEQNDFIRSLEDREIVWVADVEQEFYSQSPNNLTGFSLIHDDVHLTKEGNYLIVKTILDLLQKEKLVKKDWWHETWPLYTLDEFLERVEFSSEDQFDIYLKTAKYTMKNPFLHFSIAKAYLDEAEAIDNKSWKTKAARASIAFLQGSKEEADAFLHEADKLYGLPLKSEQVQNIPYLSQLWQREN